MFFLNGDRSWCETGRKIKVLTLLFQNKLFPGAESCPGVSVDQGGS